jgi:hypothetical protein
MQDENWLSYGSWRRGHRQTEIVTYLPAAEHYQPPAEYAGNRYRSAEARMCGCGGGPRGVIRMPDEGSAVGPLLAARRYHCQYCANYLIAVRKALLLPDPRTLLLLIPYKE